MKLATARPGRVPPQLIVGILIAVMGLVGYFMKTQVNPVTGEKQRVGNLTPADEVRLGLALAPKMAQQMGGLVPDADAQARLVDEVGRRLVQYSDAAKSPYRFEFHLVPNDMVNAFALPGGQIFITAGLLNKLETEAQLAGVLAHEIGHVVHRHSAEHMAKGQLGQSLVAAVAVGASDNRGRGMSAAMIASAVENMFRLRYGREDEHESDTYGLEYMTQAGYDPRGMIGVMKVLQQTARGGRTPEFLSTHPDPGNREEMVKQFIARRFPGGIPGHLTDGRRLK